MARYAEGTTVPVDRSRAEVERILSRYGASSFAYGWQQNRIMIMFEAHQRRVRFDLTMPEEDDQEFWETPAGYDRSASAAHKAWEQETRRRWRALALVIKAKLEAIESGLVTFEEEFMAHIVLPNNMTVGQWVGPQLERTYSSGELPALLPGAMER